jgi:hypothetical protein
MVRTEVAVPAPGVMVLGENEQFRVVGRPPQERAMGLVNAPDCDPAETVKVPDCPARIVTDAGEAEKDSDGAGCVGGGAGGPPPVVQDGV